MTKIAKRKRAMKMMEKQTTFSHIPTAPAATNQKTKKTTTTVYTKYLTLPCKAALRRVDQLLKAGYRWVVDADLQKFFDTIGHELLMQLVAERIADGRVLQLIQKYLEQGVLEDMREWQPETGNATGRSH